MKRILPAIGTLLLTQTVFAGQQQSLEIVQAQEATAAFSSTLKAELVQAMQNGGPLSAIEICNVRAPEISAAVSLEKGMNVSRVSLKHRNPDNQPNTWQAEVLNAFEARKQAGEKPGALSWNATSETDKGGEFRYMKAIPTGGICLQCHGQAIAPAVAEKLAELYPQDQATGYSEGDIRGAFVVTRMTD